MWAVPHCCARLQVMRLIDNELSEPYSIFTYRRGSSAGPRAAASRPLTRGSTRCFACWLGGRFAARHAPNAPLPGASSLLPHLARYFLHSWPHLCFLVFKGDHCFGTVVAKMDVSAAQHNSSALASCQAAPACPAPRPAPRSCTHLAPPAAAQLKPCLPACPPLLRWRRFTVASCCGATSPC